MSNPLAYTSQDTLFLMNDINTRMSSVLAPIAQEMATIMMTQSPSSGSGTPSPGSGSPLNNAGFDKDWSGDLTHIPEGQRQAFLDKVKQIANDLGTDPDWLMAIMKLESGINPAAVNSSSGATGLIQFMKGEDGSAAKLGTSVSALKTMDPLQQLDYVAKYLAPYKGKMNTMADAYLAVFSPAFIGKGDDHVAYSTADGAAYSQNKGLDTNGDGKITNGELGRKLQTFLA